MKPDNTMYINVFDFSKHGEHCYQINLVILNSNVKFTNDVVTAQKLHKYSKSSYAT